MTKWKILYQIIIPKHPILLAADLKEALYTPWDSALCVVSVLFQPSTLSVCEVSMDITLWQSGYIGAVFLPLLPPDSISYKIQNKRTMKENEADKGRKTYAGTESIYNFNFWINRKIYQKFWTICQLLSSYYRWNFLIRGLL